MLWHFLQAFLTQGQKFPHIIYTTTNKLLTGQENTYSRVCLKVEVTPRNTGCKVHLYLASLHCLIADVITRTVLLISKPRKSNNHFTLHSGHTPPPFPISENASHHRKEQFYIMNSDTSGKRKRMAYSTTSLIQSHDKSIFRLEIQSLATIKHLIRQQNWCLLP